MVGSKYYGISQHQGPEKQDSNPGLTTFQLWGFTHLLGHEGQTSKHRSVQTMVPVGTRGTSVNAPEKL